MEIFFTKIDSDIERKIKKDPLRQQVIWTKFANRLYPTVNSTTGEMKGFIIASLGLEIMERFRNTVSKQELKKIQVMYEMIIMYMLIENVNDKNVGFLGKENGSRYYNGKANQNPLIKMNSEKKEEKRILVRQDQLGYIARYKSKLENNNIEIRKNILKIAFKDNKEIESFINFFIDLIKKRDIGIRYKECFKDKEFLKNRLLEILKIEENKKEDYFKALNIIDMEGRTYILKKISNRVKNNQIVDAQDIINEVLEENPQSVDSNIKEILEEIKSVENFLVPLNNIFFQRLSKVYDEKVNQENIKILKNCYKKIIENDELVEIVLKKYNNLKETLYSQNCSKNDIEKAIIMDHQEIFKKEKIEPWIKIDESDNITVNHNVNEKCDDLRWNNYYFIDVIAHIIRSMDEWKK